MRGLPSEHLHGVVSRRELLAAGVGRRAIEHRLTNGSLHHKYDGVYAVGRPELSILGERRAIVLACGDGAVLSHRSAAAAWGLRPDSSPRWEVTVPAAARREPAAPVRIRRSDLAADEIRELDGIPTTTVARTLIDLAAVVPPHQLRRAVERAEQLELFDLRELRRLTPRPRRRPGVPKLVELLDDIASHGLTMPRRTSRPPCCRSASTTGCPARWSTDAPAAARRSTSAGPSTGSSSRSTATP